MPQRTLSEREFNAIRDRLLAQAPDGLSEQDFHRWIGPRMAAAVGEAESSAPTPEGSAVGRFASNMGGMLNPVTMVKGLVGAVVPERFGGTGPINTLGNIYEASANQGRQALDMARQGRYVEAAGHAGGMIPLIGPAAAAAGEQIAQGDVAGGVGAGAGLIAQMGIPTAVGKLKGARVPAIAANRDAAVARAVETGRAAGVPIDAATATGNPFVKFAQKTADESLIGSFVGGRAKAQQQAGLTRMGEDLAGKAHPTAVSAGQAGEAAQQGGRAAVRAQRVAANEAYDRLRRMEADPANAATFQPEVTTPGANAPWSFTTKAKPKVDELFDAVLTDAKANGYTGKSSDLRAKFDARVEQAKSLKAATAEGDEYSHAALLKEIRSRGGLRPFDPDFVPGSPTRQMRGEYQSAQQANAKYYGKNAVYRNDGLAADDMLQQLSEDPKWGAVITPDTDLTDLIHRGAMRTPELPGNIEHHLRGVGVQPGSTWWNEGAPAQTVHMAVDLSPVKEAMRPIHAKLAEEAKLVPLMGPKATAYTRLDALLNGPDVAPLSVADAALSQLKALARSNNPDLRNAGQGIAAKAVNELHQMVSEAAERAGPDAVAALVEGRQATIAKYAAADVLKQLEGRQGTKSPVTAFRGMTGAAGTDHLRDVLTQTPTAKPLIGRAVLDGIIDSPTMGPDASFKAWQRMAPDTKRLLYEPGHIKALDDFFLLRKKIAENPNPSGSGLTMLKGGELYLQNPGITIGMPALSALLHSESGVTLLTRGFRLPGLSRVAMAGYVGELMKAADRVGVPLAPPVFAGDTQR